MGQLPDVGKPLLPFPCAVAPFKHFLRENPNMDDKKIIALAKKNAAKAAKSSGRKGFGKKYDKNLADLPTDEATLKERQENERFFKEMRKREF
jgi:hypothetical protein